MRTRSSLSALGAFMAVIVASITVFAAPAGAIGTQTLVSTVPETSTGWQDQLGVARFDPALGVLDGVRVELVVSASADASVENTAPAAQGLQLTLGGVLQLALPAELVDLGFPTEITAEQAQAFSVPAADGVVDFAGSSARQFTDVRSRATFVAELNDPASFGPFVGLSELQIPAVARESSRVRSDGGVETAFDTRLGVTLSVTYRFRQPGISVSKDPVAPVVAPGGTADFTIRVTNTGETPLSNVTVKDPLASDCDRLIGELPVGEASTYLCSMTEVEIPAGTAPGSTEPANASPGNVVVNTVTVTGQTGGIVVSDRDSAEIRVGTPAVGLAIVPGSQTVTRGGTAAFVVTVGNTGNLPLTELVVSAPAAPQCATIIASLAPGETAMFDCSLVDVRSTVTNEMTVTAQSAGGAVRADAGALVSVVQPQPGIGIENDINGDDADSAPGVTVEPGAPLLFGYTVTNLGDDALSNIEVVDDQLGRISCPRTELAPGSTMVCTPVEQNQAGIGVTVHTATVSATGTAGTVVTASDAAYHRGARSAVCPATAGMLVNLRFQINDGAATTSLEGVVARPGDVITVVWDAFAAGADGCTITLAQHATTSLIFDQMVEQPLVAMATCKDNDCATTNGFLIQLAVVDSAGPNQFDLVTGPAKSSVGPLGGFYSAILNGSTNTLLSAGTSPGS